MKECHVCDVALDDEYANDMLGFLGRNLFAVEDKRLNDEGKNDILERMKTLLTEMEGKPICLNCLTAYNLRDKAGYKGKYLPVIHSGSFDQMKFAITQANNMKESQVEVHFRTDHARQHEEAKKKDYKGAGLAKCFAGDVGTHTHGMLKLTISDAANVGVSLIQGAIEAMPEGIFGGRKDDVKENLQQLEEFLQTMVSQAALVSRIATDAGCDDSFAADAVRSLVDTLEKRRKEDDGKKKKDPIGFVGGGSESVN